MARNHGTARSVSLARSADFERGAVKMGVAPVLLLSGVVGLWSCLNGVEAPGTVGWWAKFVVGVVSVAVAGAFYSGGRWERATAALRGDAP